MYGNNMYNQYGSSNSNGYYSNDNYNQNNNVVKKKKSGFFGTFFLLVLLVLAIVALLQVTHVIDVVSVFEEKVLNNDKGNNDKDSVNKEDNKEEKSEEEIINEKLKKYCSTYGTEVSETKIYVNGRFVTSDEEFDRSEVIDDIGFPKQGEMCGISNGQVNCLYTTEERVHYAYNCVTNEMSKTSYDEFSANIINVASCTMVDNTGYYVNEENNVECNNFVCKTKLNEKEYIKNCR